MLKATYGTLLLASALMFALGVSGLMDPRPRVSISGNYTPAGDSVSIRATVSSKDAQNQAVSQFLIEWLQAGVVVASVSTPGALSVTLVRTFKAPLAGDTALYSACATATDRKGQTSRACSDILRVLGPPWTPPTPPVIQIDTVAYEAGRPNGLEMFIAPPTWGGRVSISSRNGGAGMSMALNDTVTVVALYWENGFLHTPGDVVKWELTDSSTLAIVATSSNTALIRALKQTSLGLREVPQTRLGTP